MNPATGSGSIWHSMERRLLVLVSALLVVVVVTLSLLAYRTLRTALFATAEEHAAQVGSELATMLEANARSPLEELGEFASRPAVAAVARGDSLTDDMRAELEELAESNSSIVTVGIASDGEWLVQVDALSDSALASDSVPESDPVPESVRTAAPPASDAVGVGPIRDSDGAVFFDLSAPIPAAVGEEGEDPRGRMLVTRRRIASGGDAQSLAALVGSDARFLVGSAAGDTAWTDLAGGVQSPERVGNGGYRWQDTEYRGAVVEVAGTPWQVWVGLPRSEVMAPARAFAGGEALLAALITLLGGFGAWILGRHVSRPIVRLTHAADEISRGAYDERVPVQGRDEVARLATAFNVMAGRVEEATENLESKVEDRTRRLRATLDELQEAQEQLVRRERLAILGQLSSGVGHELRNPLGVMTNAVYYLEAVSPDPPPKVAEYFGILRTQLGLAEKIVSDLLDFARVKPPEHAPAPLETILEEQLARLDVPDSIELERDYAENLAPALVDRVQIGQVVFNLLTNAVQAMDGKGGRLAVATAPGGDDEVTLTVADTGKGIAPDDLERIFEPLYTTKARGIGLGLSLSRSLVEINNGRIDVRSRPGEGTTFEVSLPTG